MWIIVTWLGPSNAGSMHMNNTFSITLNIFQRFTEYIYCKIILYLGDPPAGSYIYIYIYIYILPNIYIYIYILDIYIFNPWKSLLPWVSWSFLQNNNYPTKHFLDTIEKMFIGFICNFKTNVFYVFFLFLCCLIYIQPLLEIWKIIRLDIH